MSLTGEKITVLSVQFGFLVWFKMRLNVWNVVEEYQLLCFPPTANRSR